MIKRKTQKMMQDLINEYGEGANNEYEYIIE